MNPYEPPIQAQLVDDRPPPRRNRFLDFLEACWQLFIILVVIATIIASLSLLGAVLGTT